MRKAFFLIDFALMTAYFETWLQTLETIRSQKKAQKAARLPVSSNFRCSRLSDRTWTCVAPVRSDPATCQFLPLDSPSLLATFHRAAIFLTEIHG